MPRSWIRSISTGLSVFLTLLLAACGGLSAEEHLARAKELHQKGDLQAASIELKNALQKAPDLAEARLVLGQLYVDVGDGASAEKELGRARDLGVASSSLVIPLTRAKLLQSRFQDVVQEQVAEASTGTAPSDLAGAERAELTALRAHAYLGTGKLDTAERLYGEALALSGESREALMGKARLAAMRGDLAGARAQLEQLVAAAPDFGPAWDVLGDIERHEGRLKEADAAYGKAIEASRFNSPERLKRALVRVYLADYARAAEDLATLRRQGVRHPHIAYTQGLMEFRQEKYAEAQNAFEEALALAPEHLPASLYLGAAHYAQGRAEQAQEYLARYIAAVPGSAYAAKLLATVRMSRGDFAGARALLDPLLARSPNDADLLNLLASAAIGHGDTKDGLEYLQKAVAASPESPAARTRLAVGLLLEGERESAVTQLETAVKLDPNLVQADLLLIEASLRAKDFDEALKRAEALRDKQPDKAVGFDVLGRVHLARGDAEKAREALRAALKVAPGDSYAAHTLAALALQAGRLDEARELYGEVLKHRPGDLRTRLALAVIETGSGRIDEARKQFEEALKANPKALEPRVFLARYYRNTGDPRRGVALLEEARDTHEGNPLWLSELGQTQLAAGQAAAAAGTLERLVKARPDLAQAHYQLGLAYLSLGELSRAGSEMERATALDPSQLPAKVSLARITFELGDKAKAERLLDALRSAQPDHPEVQGLEGWLALREGRARDAVAALTPLWERSKTRQLALDLAAAQWDARDWEASLKTLNAWLAAHPDDVAARFRVAAQYQVLHRTTEERQALEQVLASDPKHVGALNNLGWSLRESDPKRALAYAERALGLEGDNPAVMDTAAVLLLQQGGTEKALRLLTRAAEKAPEDPTIRFHLAKAMAQGGQKQEALRLLDEVLSTQRVFPELPQAVTLRDQLRGAPPPGR